MSDTPTPPVSSPDPATPIEPFAPVPDRARPSRSATPVLGAIGFLLLACAIGYVWRDESTRGPGVDPAAFANVESQVRTLAQRPATPADPRVAALEQRLAALEQRPAPAAAPVDLGPLDKRIAALEGRPAPAPPPPVDLGPVDQRIAALEKRPAPPPPPPPVDLSPIDTRIAALEKRPVAPPVDPATVARLDELQKRLAQTQAETAQSAERAARIARVQAAEATLAAGQPLGDIAGAPPAVGRFGRVAPPTEAALRIAFPDAAARAVAASRPSTEGESVGARMWQNARSLVTIRQGDRLVLGAPAAETVGAARALLDAGDLKGAVAALAALDGPAGAAMAPWREQAQALLDARAGLATMARG